MRFFDAHCDAVMHTYDGPYDFVGGDGRGHVDLPRLRATGHAVQVFAIFAAASYYRGRDLPALAEAAARAIGAWVAASGGRLRLALTGADVAAACAPAADHVAALIGLEGGDPLAGRAENLAHFFDLGVRLIIPAWDDNPFSGTSGGAGGGLSAEGVKLVALAEALGVMVDVSHLSDAAFDQVLVLTRKPFVASHSNCRSISPAPRNLTDAQIRALADRGGVMGINLAPDFLAPDYLAAWNAALAPLQGLDAAARQMARAEAGPALAAIPRPDLAWVGRHVRHAMHIGGEGCIGLGGDLDGISFTPAGIRGVQSYPLIADALRQAGLTERQVELICWRNMARVFADVLPQVAQAASLRRK